MIRPVAVDDYNTLAAIGSAAFPGVPYDAEEMREDDQDKPPLRAERWVFELDGQIVGTASIFQIQSRYHPQRFWMDLFVHPDFQRRGVGTALYEHLLAAIAPADPISLRTFTRDDLPHGQSFFVNRGFVEGKRTWQSFLDLSAVDLAAFAHPDPAGITICPLAELMGEPDWEQRLLALYNTIQTDVPDIDPAATVELEHFRESQLQSQRFMPDQYFIARDGDRWVGLTSLWKAPQAGQANTGVTGVLREYRGRDIAWALKLRSLEAARQAGFTRVETQNASTNRPMLAINERLGFAKEPAWIHLIREF
ncbi:MAG TPA: GNAT family N-acetyltransferase [Symbiobacteriaceae bacterium]|nr:GNAT family N-acetyltransferase [Symbiobacteriaceae bacterium]